jgi:hypothetical protein
MKKYSIILVALLTSACASYDQDLQAHLEAEADFHANMQYRQEVSERKAFNPGVYSDSEFLADCEYYQMDDCY